MAGRCKPCQCETFMPGMWLMLHVEALSEYLWQRHERLARTQVLGYFSCLSDDKSAVLFHILISFMQALETEEAKEMAKKEKARLKLLEQQRKEQVDSMRAKMNADAASGEVCGA